MSWKESKRCPRLGMEYRWKNDLKVVEKIHWKRVPQNKNERKTLAKAYVQ